MAIYQGKTGSRPIVTNILSSKVWPTCSIWKTKLRLHVLYKCIIAEPLDYSGKLAYILN